MYGEFDKIRSHFQTQGTQTDAIIDVNEPVLSDEDKLGNYRTFTFFAVSL